MNKDPLSGALAKSLQDESAAVDKRSNERTAS